MKSIAFFVWILVPAGLCLAVFFGGTPHLALSYRFYDNGDVYNPLATRTYISCDYLGLSGWHTVPATAGQCPWIKMFRADAP